MLTACKPCHAQESELTPSGANLLDGRYAVFGYVVEGQDLLQQLQARNTVFFRLLTFNMS